MANKIQIRRGQKSNLPSLSQGELAYTTDTKETFVGTGSGNINLGGSHWYKGTAMSGTSTTTGAYSYSACPDVKLDDMYLNTSNGNIYACTTAGKGSAAKWTYQGCIKGAQGASGASGKGISSTAVTYASSTSGTSAPSSWSTSIPSVAAGAYLWSRTVTTYTDGTSSTSYSVARQGANGTAASEKNIYEGIFNLAIAMAENREIKSEIVEMLGDRFCTFKVGENATINTSDYIITLKDNDGEFNSDYVYIYPQTKGYRDIIDKWGCRYNIEKSVEAGEAAIFKLNYLSHIGELILKG